MPAAARWPVVLDEYIKNREVWQCSSARLQGGANTIVPDYYLSGSYRGWVAYWQDTWRSDTTPGCPCSLAWPPGWGGPVTNSFLQGRRAVNYKAGEKAEAGVFWQGIGANELRRGTNFSEISDPARYVIAGDSGANPSGYFGPAMLALRATPPGDTTNATNCGFSLLY